jgi:hypothetical protein
MDIRALHGSSKLTFRQVKPLLLHLLADRGFHEEKNKQILHDKTKDQMILEACINVWRFEHPKFQDKMGWFHTQIEEMGIWNVLLMSNITGAEQEWVELVVQFLLHYGDIGLYDLLLCGPTESRLLWEAINQAWEYQDHDANLRACIENKHRDCRCLLCQRVFCHKGSHVCGCVYRRRRTGQMLQEPVLFSFCFAM